jgi:uncharacterized caspase-like protein
MQRLDFRYFLVAVLVGLLVFSHSAQAQEKRVALVIGNGDYSTLPSLRNPENDAQTLSTALANLGFVVYLATNLTQFELTNALDLYKLKAQDSDVSLIYYAGHSAAVGDQNLIFPTDFDPSSTRQLNTLTKLSKLTELLQDGSRTNIILFDACQEPFTLQSPTGEVQLRSLAPKAPPIGTIISYASAAGHAAHDGTGHHSLFTGALLDNLASPDIDIEHTLRQVRRDVIRNSQGEQVPQTNSSLVTDFFLYPTQAIHTTMQNALMQNGFADKPLLTEISRGVTAIRDDQPAIDSNKALLRNALCAKLAPPKPDICQF